MVFHNGNSIFEIRIVKCSSCENFVGKFECSRSRYFQCKAAHNSSNFSDFKISSKPVRTNKKNILFVISNLTVKFVSQKSDVLTSVSHPHFYVKGVRNAFLNGACRHCKLYTVVSVSSRWLPKYIHLSVSVFGLRWNCEKACTVHFWKRVIWVRCVPFTILHIFLNILGLQRMSFYFTKLPKYFFVFVFEA